MSGARASEPFEKAFRVLLIPSDTLLKEMILVKINNLFPD